MNRCIICKGLVYGWGNNAEPIANGICCDGCNSSQVIPRRLAMMLGITQPTTHTHRFEFDNDIDINDLLSILEDNMGYNDCEIVKIEPKVFDVIVNISEPYDRDNFEPYDRDNFVDDVHYWVTYLLGVNND